MWAVVVEAFSSPEFLTGLRWGGITATVALIVGIVWRRWRESPAPVAGLAAVTAAILAMPIVRAFNANLLVGLGLLIVAGAAFQWTRRVPFLTVLAAVPGAWLIGGSDLPRSGGVVSLVLLVIVFGGPVISWFDEDANGSPLPTLLFALAAAGVWVTVPDTEEALVLLGAMAAPSMLAWPLRTARLGAIGIHALVGVFLWVIVWGGRGRAGSIVGAAAALGMLIAAPLAAWLAKKTTVTTAGRAGLSLLVLHVLVVALVTRVAGLKTGASDAALIAAPVVVAATLLWLFIERRLSVATPNLIGSN